MRAAVGIAWQADLELEFARCGDRTTLVRNRHRGPLQVQKALYPEGSETCHIALLHPPGGIVGGDQLRITASVERGAAAVLTTPGAAKWYRSEGADATQDICFEVQDQSMLEWLPRESILFDGSRAALTCQVQLHAGARYIGWEILIFGRRASGETWQRGALRMKTSIRRDAALLWSETAEVAAASGFARSAVGLRGRSVCGTLLVAASEVSAALLGACRAVEAHAGSISGITWVPGILVARYLGDSSEGAFAWFTDLWRTLRPALSGKAAHPPRVWAC